MPMERVDVFRRNIASGCGQDMNLMFLQTLMSFDRILLDKYKKDAGQLLCPFPVF